VRFLRVVGTGVGISHLEQAFETLLRPLWMQLSTGAALVEHVLSNRGKWTRSVTSRTDLDALFESYPRRGAVPAPRSTGRLLDVWAEPYAWRGIMRRGGWG
jgi:hypothetical protein